MGHSHSHHHSNSTSNLRTVFFLNFGFTIFEIIGGFYVNSVAIISDAVHDLGDSISLGISWYLESKSKQKGNSKFTFGYQRFSLLGALINSIILIIGSCFVIYEAIKRFIEPEFSDPNGMIVFAIIGVAVNGYAAWKLSGGKSMNEKVVSWHLLEDVLGWLAVLIVAIILKFKQTPYLDPALSLLISGYILWNVIKRLKETMHIFLQGVPNEYNLNEIELKLTEIKNVASTHHTHVWSLDGEKHVLTSHIKLKSINSLPELLEVKKELNNVLKSYKFQHHTIEVELIDEKCRLADC